MNQVNNTVLDDLEFPAPVSPSGKRAAEPSRTSPAVQLADYREARLGQILTYLKSSLARDDALESVMGSMNAGVLRITLWLEEAIEQVMSSGPPSLETYEQLSAAFTTYLKLTRQAAQFAQLEFHSAQARRAEQRDLASLQERLDSLPEA